LEYETENQPEISNSKVVHCLKQPIRRTK